MEQSLQNWSPYAIEYDPLKAGSIDGTDTEPHDKAISRAIQAHYEPPHGLKSKPERTLFVARFGPKITKHDLKEIRRSFIRKSYIRHSHGSLSRLRFCRNEKRRRS